MFNFIKGIVAAKTENAIVLEANGIGFEFSASRFTINACAEVGSEEKLFAHMQVKEDLISLIGFKTLEEKQMFLSLIEVQGVGARVAMQALGAIECGRLAKLIASGDIEALIAAKVAGRKLSERIVLELKNKFKNLKTFGSMAASGETICGLGSETIESATAILTGLGMTKKEALDYATKFYDNNIKEVGELVQKVLKGL